jgi:hypothetical protein
VGRITNRELWAAGLLYGDPTKLGANEPLRRLRNAHPEQGVLNAVMQFLRTHPRVWWCARINTGAFKTPDGRFVRFGFVGCADIIGQLKAKPGEKTGAFLAIECKSDAGQLTDDQRVFLEKVGKYGAAGVARSIEDARAIVEGW